MRDEDIMPIVDVRRDGYYVGIWFLAGPGRDWMGVVDRDPETGRFRLISRFRYYKDPDERDGFNPFDTDDVKNGLNADFKDKPEGECIELVDGVVDEMVKSGWCGTRLPWKVRQMRHKNLVQGDGEKFLRILVGLPYTHFTTDPSSYKPKVPGAV